MSEMLNYVKKALFTLVLAVFFSVLVLIPDEIYKLVNVQYPPDFDQQIFFILILSYALALSTKGKRAPVVLTAVFFVITGSEILHFEYFGTLISPNEITLLATEIDEIFLSLTTMWFEITVIFVGLFALLLPVIKVNSLTKAHRLSMPLASIALILLYGYVLPSRAYNDPSVQNYYPSPSNYSLVNGVKALSWVFANDVVRGLRNEERVNPHHQKRQPLEVVDLMNDKPNFNLIVVMGESLNPYRMSAFGALRKTTPFLDARIDKGEIYKRIVYSGGMSTKVSIPTFFNLKKYPEDVSALTKGHSNLLRLAKKKGMDTWWLSTQSAGLATYSAQVDRRAFFSKEDIVNTHEKSTDLVLLELLKKVNLEKPSFVVLHERGSHSPYERYHPDEYDHFPEDDVSTDQKRVNSYDNSLIFSDYIHEEIIKYLEAHSSLPTIVLFTGDHGELVGENGLWGHSVLIPEGAEVPYIVWSSESAKHLARQVIELPYPTHFEVGRAVLALLGYGISDPQNVKGEYYVNGKNLAGNAPFVKFRFNDKSSIESWVVLK